MGLFKSIKKAFKKVTKGIKKVVKKTVKGIKKVVKKISSSKILKALAIAAAVVVTGGAAVAAFTGGAGVAAGTAGSTFANWMMTTSQAVTGGALFGTGATGVTGALQTAGNVAAKTIASPFKSIGTTAGNLARGVTNFTGLTDAASQGVVQDSATAQNILGRTGLTPEEINAMSSAEQMGAAQSYVDIKGGTGTFTMADIDAARATTNTTVASVSPTAMDTWSQRNPKSAAFLKGAGTVATQVGTSVAAGYAMHQLTAPDETGSMGGLRTEGASSFDPLRVYAAERGIADSDISKYFTFGNTPESGNMPLFQQQTIGVA